MAYPICSMYSGFGRHLLLNQDHLLPWVQFITVQYPDGAMVVVYECLHGPRFELVDPCVYGGVSFEPPT